MRETSRATAESSLVAVLSISLDGSPSTLKLETDADEEDEELRPELLVQRTVSKSSQELTEVALNPLDPCGACMEWLKKISEVNPDFRVLNFTSTSCEKVFITPIGDY